ncbi:MAG: hypothetical protein ACXADW_10865 [Candidatus Hodarchaeales archaeon]
MKDYLFEYEFLIFGIKRSGIHAVATWLIGHFDLSTVVYINDSFLTLHTHGLLKDFSRHIDRTEINDNIHNIQIKCFVNVVENYDLAQAGQILKDVGSKYNKEKAEKAFIYGRDKFSKKQCVVLIHRDCLNHLASFIRGPAVIHNLLTGGFINYKDPNGKKTPRYHKPFFDLRREYDDEVHGVTNHLPNKTIIFFNRWFKDKKYRKQLSESFDLKFSDRYLNELGIFDLSKREQGKRKAWGSSSFDGRKYRKKAQEMKVLDRYKYLEELGMWEFLVDVVKKRGY